VKNCSELLKVSQRNQTKVRSQEWANRNLKRFSQPLKTKAMF
jgi:hypothetical protein